MFQRDVEMRECSECHKRHDSRDFVWVTDRYGIPWRKVCDWCREKVQRQIAGWGHDPSDAGEALEPEEY